MSRTAAKSRRQYVLVTLTASQRKGVEILNRRVIKDNRSKGEAGMIVGQCLNGQIALAYLNHDESIALVRAIGEYSYPDKAISDFSELHTPPLARIEDTRTAVLTEVIAALEANDGIGSWQEAIATVKQLLEGK